MSTLMTREIPEVLAGREMMRPLSIFEEMDRLSREIQKRAFGFFEERGGEPGLDLSDWFRAESEFLRPTPIEVEEEEKEIVVRAEVPGFDAKELSVSADVHGVRIYGKTEKKEKEPAKEEGKRIAGRRYRELSSNEVLREITLPAAVNPDQAVAKLDKGILEIRLPKAVPARLIEVKSAA